MKLIVGLGNPGKEYENTRHNIGFMIVDNYLSGDKFTASKFDGLICEKNISGEKIIFLKPTTYMNNSGIAVRKVCDFYHINPEDVLIIRDDLDLEFGNIKLKFDSSSGGHNGIKSIISHLGTQKFSQFKFGITNNHKDDVIDFVLGKFDKIELANIDYKLTEEIINAYIKDGIVECMSRYN